MRDRSERESEYLRATAALAGAAGRAHLMGVGGVGVAGLAPLLQARGWRVCGCDLSENRLTRWLATRGIETHRGHDPAHVVAGCDWLIRSAAVPPEHPEVAVARARGAFVCARGIALAALVRGARAIAVAGTHGKTTTTAMLAQIARRVDPAAGWAIGGEVGGWDGVAAAPGAGGTLVVEADESDGTLALYEPVVGIITNVDFDHMEHFADENEFFDVFRAFAGRVRERLIFGADDARAREVAQTARTPWGCGLSPEAQIRGGAVEQTANGSAFDAYWSGRRLGRIELPIPGIHNVRNALTALGAALALGWPFEAAQDALAAFRPARRRLELVFDDAGIRIFSDYAHHPTEIRAILDSVRDFGHRRLLVFFQPHRYTRTRALGPQFPPAFDGAECVWLLPVYAASEAPLEGGTSDDLCRHFEARGRPPVRPVASLDEAWEALRANARAGDLVLIVGAGDIERLAERAAAGHLAG